MTLRKRLKKFFKSLLQSPYILNIISTIFYHYALLVGKTTKWQISGQKKMDDIWDKEGSFIFIGWHGRAMMLPYFWNKKHPMNALVSLHHDGRMIAGLLEKFGMKTIGGSSTENSKSAAIDLMRSLKRGEAIAIIPDGPKGPSMTLGKSALYFAQKTGKPIIGATYSVKGSKILRKSWDSMLLPPLFSKGIYATTEAFYIPKNAKEDEIEKIRHNIESQLNRLTWEADKALGLPPVPQGKKAKKRYPASDLPTEDSSNVH